MKFDILHTNDVHSNINNMSKAGHYIKTIREQNENTLLVDGGDMITGEFQFEHLKGKVEREIVNYLKYDVVTLGNHDFDNGVEFLKEHMNKIESPYVLSNMIDCGDYIGDYFHIYTIEKSGVKFGFMSLILPYVQTILKEYENLRFIEVEYYKNMIERLKARDVDVIIALNHQGLDRDIELAEMNLGIDVIIGAHSHTEIDQTYKVNNTLIAQTGCFAKNIGHIKLQVKDKKVIDLNSSLINLDDYKSEDVVLKKLIDDSLKEVEELGNIVYGSTSTVLEGRRELTTTVSTNLGALVCDSYIYQAKKLGFDAQISLINSRGIRQSIQPGVITKRDLYNVLPFGKKLLVCEVSGKDLILALSNQYIEMQTSNINIRKHTDNSRSFFEQDKKTPIDKNKLYTVVTIDYLYDHEQFTMLQNGQLLKFDIGLDIDAVANYIKSLGSELNYQSNYMVEVDEV